MDEKQVERSLYPQQIGFVHSALKTAGEHGLEPEVVLAALQFAQANPELSIEECMEAGLEEWDLI